MVVGFRCGCGEQSHFQHRRKNANRNCLATTKDDDGLRSVSSAYCILLLCLTFIYITHPTLSCIQVYSSNRSYFVHIYYYSCLFLISASVLSSHSNPTDPLSDPVLLAFLHETVPEHDIPVLHRPTMSQHRKYICASRRR